MKKFSKFFVAFLCFTIVFAIFMCLIPNISNAWDIDDVEFYDYGINDGIMNSFRVRFQIAYSGGTPAHSWIGIQKEPFDTDDLTNIGDIYDKYDDGGDHSTPSIIMNDQELVSQYTILDFSPDDDNGFATFGGQYQDVDTQFSGLNIPVDEEETYYLYLWTKINDESILYPDKLIARFDVNDGNVDTLLSVSFNSSGGTPVETQYVAHNHTATKPANPTKENQTFIGWYYYNPYLVPFDFNTPITGNVSLVAMWEDAIIANPEGFTGDYDGKEHGINVTVTRPYDYIIKYGTTEGEYDLDESPKYTEPGEYTVYYKITAEGYEDKTGEGTVYILANSREKLRTFINSANNYYDSIKDTYSEVAGTLKTAIESATVVADNDNATEAEWFNAYRRLRADITIAKIDTIGTVEYTDSCYMLLSATETEYYALPDNETKNMVTNYNTLIEAWNRYNILKNDHQAAEYVIQNINNAYNNEVQYIEEYKELLDFARETYESLTPEQKELVENYALLTELEEKYEILEKANILKANTVSFKDNLSLNFLAILDDSVVNDAYVKLTYNHYGEEKEVILRANSNDKHGDYYRFRCELTASEMTVEVKAELYLDNLDIPTSTWSRSIRQYIISGLENQNQKETEKQLFLSTLNYGGYTQRYFGYNEDLYADEGYYKDLSDVTVASEIEYVKPEGFIDGIKYYGASVFFRNAPYARYYFELEDGKDISDYRFEVGGNTYTPEEKDGRYYIDAPSQLAYELDNEQNVVVTSSKETIFGYKYIFGFKYSIITWAKLVVENSTNDNEISAAKAMYEYYQTAKAFVDNNTNH